jgi:hypothetical protein
MALASADSDILIHLRDDEAEACSKTHFSLTGMG